MVMLLPHRAYETALESFGHAGIFIIIGWAVTYLRRRHEQDLLRGVSLADIPEITPPLFRRHGPVAIAIAASTVLAFVLNSYLIFTENNLIFDPLFYFPIILIAYFYPRQGVLATTAYSIVFCAMVFLAAQGSVAVTVTGLLHASIFIIIGFVLSYIVRLYTHEQEIHKRLAEIVESSSDAIIGKTLDGTITDWNRASERLYGYSADEIVGRSISLLVPPDRPDELQKLLETIKRGEALERYETERLTKDGRRIWVSLAISPIRSDAGTVIGASVIAFDITERRLAEDALRQANRKLQLFSSITRHDVLNQLTVLNIYHNLTESMIEDPVALSFLDKAKKAADAISRQIQFTHEYQEIGANSPRWISVRAAFIGAAAEFRARPVTINPCATDAAIYADPLLTDVFSKLIEHSLTYDELVNEIRCSCSEDGLGLLIVYEDNGIGIEEEEKQKIFEKATGDEPRPQLFLVKEILSITNITIAETGTPGKGTRFEIHVPDGLYRFARKREQP